MTLFHIEQKYLRISVFIIVKIIIFAFKEIIMKTNGRFESTQNSFG